MHAIILFAHGSRDPLWHKPIQAVAQRIAERDTKVLVRCAYLELTEPDLLHVANELASAGATSISVVPLFLGVGKHAREDLPLLIAQVKAAHPKLKVTCQPAVGEQERLLDLLADIALKGDA
jgi:sirohydrochlorin cobaltochelatase